MKPRLRRSGAAARWAGAPVVTLFGGLAVLGLLDRSDGTAWTAVDVLVVAIPGGLAAVVLARLLAIGVFLGERTIVVRGWFSTRRMPVRELAGTASVAAAGALPGAGVEVVARAQRAVGLELLEFRMRDGGTVAPLATAAAPRTALELALVCTVFANDMNAVPMTPGPVRALRRPRALIRSYARGELFESISATARAKALASAAARARYRRDVGLRTRWREAAWRGDGWTVRRER